MKASNIKITTGAILIGVGMLFSFGVGALMNLDIDTGIDNIDNAQHIYDTETKIVYVDRDIIVTVPVIEYVEKEVYIEVPVDTDVTLTAMANHQDYVDWFENYEELIDEFIDQLYRERQSAYNLAKNYNRYLQAKLDNGELLDAVQVEFMFEYRDLELEWVDFNEWLDNEIEPIYNELMDDFPQEVEQDGAN